MIKGQTGGDMRDQPGISGLPEISGRYMVTVVPLPSPLYL
jgi:hypothetical protein